MKIYIRRHNMKKARTATRVGAAVFALGLSLAGH